MTLPQYTEQKIKEFEKTWFDGVYVKDRDTVNGNPYLHCEGRIKSFLTTAIEGSQDVLIKQIRSVLDAYIDMFECSKHGRNTFAGISSYEPCHVCMQNNGALMARKRLEQVLDNPYGLTLQDEPKRK